MALRQAQTEYAAAIPTKILNSDEILARGPACVDLKAKAVYRIKL